MLRRVCFTAFLLLSAASLLHAQPEVEELPAARAVLDASGFKGTTLIYDLNNQRWMAGHAELVDTEVLPASTFKLFSSLVALETRVIHAADEIIPWDGVTRGRLETNTDMSLRDAFRISSVPHYQHLVREIGSGRMGVLLREAGYGNMHMDGGLETFWLSGDLRITPRQQIEFMLRLYNNELPFRPEVIRTVKDIALMEDTESYKLRAKTGLAQVGDGENTGWWVGWVEKNDNVYFFATLLLAQNPDDSFVPKRLGITREILSQLNILPAEPK
ncbi:MAG: penicillin-binding transpeptidase domain-containing protein [Pseudohongiella sp.]|nr:penicillin-binding transpeptidase domain-containing protein [Pseudohongiella sp.]